MTQIATTDFTPATTADATAVNSNFSAVKSTVNGNLDDGNLAAGANITPSKISPGTNGQVLSTVAGVTAWAAASGSSAAVPSGVVCFTAAAAAPTDWLICDGTAVSRTTYAALFTAIGTAYGVGDGTTTFNLPDLRGRVPVGLGTHADVNALNDNDAVTLASRRPYHTHTVTISNNSTMAGGATGTAVAQSVSTSATGPAYVVLNGIIKT